MSFELDFGRLLERNPEAKVVWNAGDLWYWRWPYQGGPHFSVIGAEDLLTTLDLPLEEVRGALWYNVVWHEAGVSESRWMGVVPGHLKRVREVLSPNWNTEGAEWRCPSCQSPLRPSHSGHLWCDQCRIEVIEHTNI